MVSSPDHIIWHILFSTMVFITVVPFPFKMHGYFTGKDPSSIWVKIDEMTSVLLTWVGLLGLYGFLNNIEYLSSTFWYLWVVVMAGLTTFGYFWSPKMKYAKEVFGRRNWLIAYSVTVVMYFPMFAGIYLYAETL